MPGVTVRALRARAGRALARQARRHGRSPYDAGYHPTRHENARYGSPDEETLRDLGYVVVPQRRAAAAAAGAGRVRSVIFDLHETLVRVEPIPEGVDLHALLGRASEEDDAGDETRRGAPAGCLEEVQWTTSEDELGTSTARFAPHSKCVLHGPPGGGDFLLHTRPGARQLVAALRRPEFEGIIWTVGGLLYVKAVIDVLDDLPQKAFQHHVMSNNAKYDLDGNVVSEHSDWPFLHDCKPLTMLNRNLPDCLQVDDRPEYMRLHLNNSLLIPPYLGDTPGNEPDKYLNNLLETLELLRNSTQDVPDFLESLPQSLAVKKKVDGFYLSCIA
ncbi:hypothetical protein DIPPA_34832 [Diplonema papillatum]|nr:hypothetical protein DIPPA_34832 [Diplonema papillatum]|eukprot:gene20196-31054_t